MENRRSACDGMYQTIEECEQACYAGGYVFFVWDPDAECARIGGWWMCIRPELRNCCACSRVGPIVDTDCYEGGFDQFACEQVLIKDGLEDWDQCEFHEGAECQPDDTCAPAPAYKWDQPPVSAYPDNVYLGWNEESTFWDLGFTVADDWVCTGDEPVTQIFWWGSFVGWKYPYPPPPEELPSHFHILFWTDVPVGPDEDFSHPGRVIHEILCYDFVYEFFGWDYDPRAGDYEATFVFETDLDALQEFHQDPGGDPTIYWLSISACYEGVPPPTANPWGWKTRPRDPQSPAPDDAVVISEPTMPSLGMDYIAGWPIEYPEEVSWDTAFELGGQLSIKWSQPPEPYDPPDAFHGWDEPSIDEGVGGYYIVADDWFCDTEAPVTDIHWWGSFLGWYEQELPTDMPEAFHISIWTDVPAAPALDCCQCLNVLPPATACEEGEFDELYCLEVLGAGWDFCEYHSGARCRPDDTCEQPFSHPGEVIWETYCDNFTWDFVGWDFDPRNPEAPPEATFKFNQDVLDTEWFFQAPGDNIYWLSIAAVYSDVIDIEHPFGWKTRPRDPDSPAPDDGVRIFDPTTTTIGSAFNRGEPIWWPTPDVSWDLAFSLTTREVEACCLEITVEPSCVDLPPSECLDILGIPQGPGTHCTTEEACCLEDDTCMMVDPICCDDAGGRSQGPGTECTPVRACCFEDGTCDMLDPLCCADIGGTPMCPECVCGGALEACCLEDGRCMMADPTCCPLFGGEAQGPGSTCEGMEACCLPIDRGAACVDADALCCRNEIGGTPQGPETECTPEQACCFAQGLCMMLDPLCCVSELDGTPMGPGSVCGVAAEGCCLEDGECRMTDPTCCPLFPGGTAQGPGTECTVLEGCCLDDGTCLDVDPLCCDELGGMAQGLGTGCVDMTIACCLPDGGCADVDPLCCDDLEGVPSPIGAPHCLGDANGNGIDDACEEPNLKWVQLPDLTETGVDVRLGPDATSSRILADDFECNEPSLITGVRLWGSWKHDLPGLITLIHLEFYTDDPVGPGGSDPENPFSKPDELLWERDFSAGEFTIVPYAVVEPGEWWWDPETGELIEAGDTQVWKIDVDIDPHDAFRQGGGQTDPVVYWLAVRIAMAEGEFGWKTRQWPAHYNDDAVWDFGSELPRLWSELRYPLGHPLVGESVDLAFGLTSSAAVRRPMAEDCATVAPGNRCSDSGTCTTDDDCAFLSHCVPPPTGEDGMPVCYAPKTRYLSIARHPNQVDDTARRVKLDTGEVLGWLGEPYWVPPTSQHDGLWVSDIVHWMSAPHYAVQWPDVVHVTGCQIAHASLCDLSGVHCEPNLCPGTETCERHSYRVQAIQWGDDPSDETRYSEALELRTNAVWGDTVASCGGDTCLPSDGLVGLDDILAAIKYFQGVRVAPITWIDIAPSVGVLAPDRLVGLDDIMACIDGFMGGMYPGRGPSNCGPSEPRIGSYSNSGCLDRDIGPCVDPDEIELTPGPGTLDVLHLNATYNCCPHDIAISLSAADNLLELTEQEILIDPCYCICCYNVQAAVVDLTPGTYTVRFCWFDYETWEDRCYEEVIEIP